MALDSVFTGSKILVVGSGVQVRCGEVAGSVILRVLLLVLLERLFDKSIAYIMCFILGVVIPDVPEALLDCPDTAYCVHSWPTVFGHP